MLLWVFAGQVFPEPQSGELAEPREGREEEAWNLTSRHPHSGVQKGAHSTSHSTYDPSLSSMS